MQKEAASAVNAIRQSRQTSTWSGPSFKARLCPGKQNTWMDKKCALHQMGWTELCGYRDEPGAGFCPSTVFSMSSLVLPLFKGLAAGKSTGSGSKDPYKSSFPVQFPLTQPFYLIFVGCLDPRNERPRLQVYQVVQMAASQPAP